MSILSRSYPLLAFLFCLSAAPAFSAEEVQAGVTTPTDGSISKAEARSMLKSEGVKVIISTPADGSTIKAMARNKVQYSATGADVAHASLYIDGSKSVFLRKRIGTHKIANLTAGIHELCVKALDKSHKVVGVASCVKVTAQ